MNIPYCCIGRFVVTLSNEKKIQPPNQTRRFYGLTNPQDMDVNCIPTLTKRRIVNPCLVLLQLRWNPKHSCKLAFKGQSDGLGEEIVAIHNCVITENSNNDITETGFCCHLEILQGDMIWLQFLESLNRNEEDGYGTALMECKNGTSKERRVMVKLSDQPDLPWPPKEIQLRIL